MIAHDNIAHTGRSSANGEILFLLPPLHTAWAGSAAARKWPKQQPLRACLATFGACDCIFHGCVCEATPSLQTIYGLSEDDASESRHRLGLICLYV